MEVHRVKSLNKDKGSKKKLKFASSRQRSKQASADVYRKSKRSASSTGIREAQLHNPTRQPSKRQRTNKYSNNNTTLKNKNEKSVVFRTKNDNDDDFDDDDDDKKFEAMQLDLQLENGEGNNTNEIQDHMESTFTTELDVTLDRNGSEIFAKFHREVWPLVRSLAETLHHAEKVIDLLLSYMLSLKSNPERPCAVNNQLVSKNISKNTTPTPSFMINHATTDMLHLLAVLARDLRHEIHPYMHTKIIPCIIYDLLQASPVSKEESQPIPLDVSFVEAAFRCLSYLFRYDSDELVKNMDQMRQYYGATLGSRREVTRRLASETFAPLIRKIKSDTLRQRHLRRVIRALAASCAASGEQQQSQNQQNNNNPSAIPISEIINSSFKRNVTDTVDGVASLLCQLVRGVSGQLHSKGRSIIQFVFGLVSRNYDSLKLTDNKSHEVVFLVVSAFVNQVLKLIDHANYTLLLQELLLLSSSPSSPPPCDGGKENVTHNGLSLFYNVKLIAQLAERKQASFLSDCNNMKPLIGGIEKLCNDVTLSMLPQQDQTILLSLFCTIWRYLPENNSKVIAYINDILGRILKLSPEENYEHSVIDIEARSRIISMELLPYLSTSNAIEKFGNVLLTTAAEMSSNKNAVEATLVLVANVGSSLAQADTFASDFDYDHDAYDATMTSTTTSDDEYSALFFLDVCGKFTVKKEARSKLLNNCFMDTISLSKLQPNNDNESDSIAILGLALRCAPFLTMIQSTNDDKGGISDRFKSTAKWLLQCLKDLQPDEASSTEEAIAETNVLIVKSLAIEALSRLTMKSIDKLQDRNVVKTVLSKVKPFANNLLRNHGRSASAIRAVAAFARTLQLVELPPLLHDKADEVFETLIPNLRSNSHSLRLGSLQILSCFPMKQFVVDHADIDFSGDLDEEPNDHLPQPSTGHKNRSNNDYFGVCDIVNTLLEIERIPISMSNERQLTSLISRVEVMGRSGKLPVIYAEAAASHMLGIFHLKYAPIWAVACSALVGLSVGHKDVIWEPIRERLIATIENHPTQTADDDKKEDYDSDGNDIVDAATHHATCVKWEESSGNDTLIFGRAPAVAQDGTVFVSKFSTTDSDTVLEWTWKVAEEAPILVATNSRDIVSLFLRFLHYQYFCFHSGNPDGRELRLEQYIDNDESTKHDISANELSGSILYKKLTAFMKAFAAITGPQQLSKHRVLKMINLVFLSNPDNAIVELALTFLLKYKVPYIRPYETNLKGLLKKAALKDALLDFNESINSGKIIDDHRQQLLPVISRIIFGKVSSRLKGNKKHSPASLRSAGLSFLSTYCQNDDDLFNLLYLMTRVFLPKSFDLVPLEEQDSSYVTKMKERLLTICVDDIADLPPSVCDGFLNLLQPVISQFGHRIVSIIPQLTNIVIVLCKRFEVQMYNDKNNKTDEIINDTVDETEGVETSTAAESKGFDHRSGGTRTSCFHRISELMTTFAGSIDFTVHSTSLWDAIKGSIQLLPDTVGSADKVPSMLSLLETMTSHPNLIPLLVHYQEAIESVIKCISRSSTGSVTTSILTFIGNLLNNGQPVENTKKGTSETLDTTGLKLVSKRIPLLLQHFMLRLETGPRMKVYARVPNKATGKLSNTSTWKQELEILFQIGQVIALGEDVQLTNTVDELENLCTLLIPYVESEKMRSDEDKLSVLRILTVAVRTIGNESSMSIFFALSRLLGPYKAKPRISSLQIRSAISDVIFDIANNGKCDPEMVKVATMLRKLCTIKASRVDEMDYEVVIVALNSLGETGDGTFWDSISNLSLLKPLISTCFHFMYNEDGVIYRGAFVAVKAILSTGAKHITLNASEEATIVTSTKHEQTEETWKKLIEGLVVPSIRSGLNSRNAPVRRYFVLLIAETARHFREHSSPNLYGDLHCLIRDDNEDLDFFSSFTHVQIHRRTRSLQRLRKLLAPEDVESAGQLFSQQSLSNVLLPLIMHPIYECKTKLEEPLVLEAVATVGALSKFLSWSKYSKTLWTILTQFHRHVEQERHLISLICSILDGFNFSITSTPVEGRTINDNDDAADDDEEDNNNDDEEGDDAPQMETPDEETNPKMSAVWRALEKRIIPKTDELLVKEKTDRDGRRLKILRPNVVLALLKLFQKFPTDIFESKLPRLLTVLCDSLKNRDSNVRDIARATMSKVVLSMDLKYLADVLREVAITLTEGYQLHVRCAVIHSILLTLSDTYKLTPSDDLGIALDNCVAALMDLLQQDLFGVSRDRREADGNRVRYVKEAGGNKSMHSIEVLCSMINFNPSKASSHGSTKGKSMSAIHNVVSPLLERLRSPNVDAATIRKIRECFTHVVNGLSRNPNVTLDELLPFVYSTLAPFVSLGKHAKAKRKANHDDDDNDDNDSDSDSEDELIISGSSDYKLHKHSRTKNKSTKNVVVTEWRPSTLKASNKSKDAVEAKRQEIIQNRRVQDGASAPKLTGSGRYGTNNATTVNSINDPAGISAVIFCLSSLHSYCKKKGNEMTESYISMVDPFVPLLNACVCNCKDTDVVLLAIKCLGSFLRLKLPSTRLHAKSLGEESLKLLSSSVATPNQSDLTQACFKTLTLLFHFDESKNETSKEIQSENDFEKHEKVFESSKTIPLDPEQMKVLLSLVKVSITDTEQYHSALNLIRAIQSRRYISPEFYDLMETILKTSVRSDKVALRNQCNSIFIRYLLDYPMGKERRTKHMKQIAVNLKYEYHEGRLSAITLATMVIEKLPAPILYEYASLLFLPLVLQMVNDNASKDCRMAVGKCISTLLKRCSNELLTMFYNYAQRWSKNAIGTSSSSTTNTTASASNNDNNGSNAALQRAAIQIFSMFIEAQIEFVQKNDRIKELLQLFQDILSCKKQNEQQEWELHYLTLGCFEKLQQALLVNKKIRLQKQNNQNIIHDSLWLTIIPHLVNPHPWIRIASSRVLHHHLQHFGIINMMMSSQQDFLSKCSSSFIVTCPGTLFDITRNLCFQLGNNESEQGIEMGELAIKILVNLVPIIEQYPSLSLSSSTKSTSSSSSLTIETTYYSDNEDDNEQAITNEEPSTITTITSTTTTTKDPMLWLMTRLSNLAKPKGTKRRCIIFKCFAAFVSTESCKSIVIQPKYLELMLEPIHRSIVETTNLAENAAQRQNSVITTIEDNNSANEGELAQDVLQLMEESCDTPADFLQAYATVKTRAMEKRENRKILQKSEHVLDPKGAAEKKIKKQQREKNRRKRKIEERRRQRGGTAKKRYVG